MGGSVTPSKERHSNMRYQSLVLLVVSATVFARDTTENRDTTVEKIKQKRSVEIFLSQLTFNPFTPFPELVTTTPSNIISSASRLSSGQSFFKAASSRLQLRNKKQDKKKKKKFPVFVAVEGASTQITILPTFVRSDEDTNKVQDAKKTQKEVSENIVTNSI